MDYPKFIVSNQKEESINIQRVYQAALKIFLFSTKTYVVGSQKNRLNETVL